MFNALNEPRKRPAALGINRALLMLNRMPLGMSGHNLNSNLRFNGKRSPGKHLPENEQRTVEYKSLLGKK
jgi:hypothetical protein